ncbi:MAG TPA: DsbA family oxidoreductase [Candidatus Dormibacteraeota bacterium]|nr:DsbA family oxidoreductase [Candidatus Dormibacteraeota bacterium]
MKVEIWSDVVCPWCYIGKRRFERALAAFTHRDEVDVVWRSFELDPDAPRQSDEEPAERLARKYGTTVEQARAAQDRVTGVAAQEGLTYRLDAARAANTFDAHRLLHLAAERGVQAAVEEALMAAHFVESRPLGDAETLVSVVAAAGLDEAAARDVLAGDAYAEAVAADEREAAELGITGVPFFVLDRRYGVSGAQPAELLQRALEQAWGDSEDNSRESP